MKIKLNFTEEQIKIIEDIISKGNQAEIKREKDQIVIIEIKRQLHLKQPIIS